MRNARTKFLALLLSVCMLASLLAVPAGAAKFDDVPDWAQKSVDRWTDAGIMEGNADGSFDPNRQMTRADFAILMCKLMGYTEKSSSSAFTDLPADSAAADALLKLHAAGVMVGVGNNQAAPNGTLTREQVAAMVFRAMNLKASSNVSMNFSDSGSVSSWAAKELATMASLKMISGMGDNTLAPKKDIPRQEMAALLDQMIAEYVTEDGAKVDTSKSANPNGVVIIKARNVTIENAADSGSILITEDAPWNATVTVTGQATDIVVAAEGAKLTVAKDAKVGSVTVEAPQTTVTVAGTVSSVAVAEGADKSTVTAQTGAKVENVTTSAKNVKVTGANNTIASVTTEKGSAEVAAKGAEVTNTGADTKVDGKPAGTGSTTTSNNTSTSTGTSSGGSTSGSGSSSSGGSTSSGSTSGGSTGGSTSGGSTSGGGSSSGGSDTPAAKKYTITFSGEVYSDFEITANKTQAAAGDTITITIGKFPHVIDIALVNIVNDTTEEYLWWVTDAKATSRSYDFTMPGSNVSITAYYGAYVTLDPQGGTFDQEGIDVWPNILGAKFNGPTNDPANKNNPTREGYTFAGWYNDKACTQPYDYDSLISSSFTLYAKWIEGEAKLGTITIASSEHGTVTVDKENGANYGDTVVVTVYADEGYEIDTLTYTMRGTNEAVPITKGQNDYSFEMPQGDVTITATFKAQTGNTPVEPQTYNIGIEGLTAEQAETCGVVSVGAEGNGAAEGTKVTINIDPKADYKLTVIVKTESGKDVIVTEDVFTMPGEPVNIIVTITRACGCSLECENCPSLCTASSCILNGDGACNGECGNTGSDSEGGDTTPTD